MIKKLNLYLLLFCLFGFTLNAQPNKSHSMALSYEQYIASLKMPRLLTTVKYRSSGIGMQGNHQYNFNNFFSLRTGFSFIKLMPYVMVNEYFDNFGSYFFEQESRHLSLMIFYVAPAIYHREKNFSLFLLPELGLARETSKTHKHAMAEFNRPSGKVVNESEETKTFHDFGFYLTPRLGSSFYLMNKSSEIEVSVSTSILAGGVGPDDPIRFTDLGLQLGYRYNFIR